jgi:hypothetical protein
MDSKAWAHWLVEEFRKRRSGGLWLHMRYDQIAAQLDARVDNPELINQNNTPFCGYAALAYSVAKNSPQQYVWFAIGLFEDGLGWFGVSGGKKARIVASSAVRTQRLPRMSKAPFDQMAEADWLVLASLREHFNAALFDVGEGIPIIGPLVRAIHGGATAGEVTGALSELGCTECYDQSSVHSTRDLGFAMAADGHFAAGHVVFLRIDADMLYADRYASPPGALAYGSHWVGLNSRIQLSPGKDWIELQVFSWGQLIDVPSGGYMRVDNFLSRFYGYVAGKF